jgi:hypothetical protein
MGVKIFVEGGGPSNRFRQELKLGFIEFFRNGLPNHNQPKVIMCGGRTEAFDDFCYAIKAKPDDFHILLLDSEGPIKKYKNKTPKKNEKPTPNWDHLEIKEGWPNPKVPDHHCQLMVQIMEAWFCAEPETLQNYFGKGFVKKHISTVPNVEKIPKLDVKDKLKKATIHSKKREYHKIRHASELLMLLDVSTVRSKAHHCDRLFQTLEQYLIAP